MTGPAAWSTRAVRRVGAPLAIASLAMSPAALAQDAGERILTVQLRDAQVLEPEYVRANQVRGSLDSNDRKWKVQYTGNLLRIDFVGYDRNDARWAHTLYIGAAYQGNRTITYTRVYRSGCRSEQITPNLRGTDIEDVEFNEMMDLEAWWGGLCRENDPAVREIRSSIQYAYCKRRAALVVRRILKWGGEPPGLRQRDCVQILSR